MSEEQDNQKKLDALKKMNAEHEKENKFLLKKKETLEESLELLQKTGHQAIKNWNACSARRASKSLAIPWQIFFCPINQYD